MGAIIGVVVLGVIQGLTEFLPVSSSGHLVIGQQVFQLHKPSILLDPILHVGTLGPGKRGTLWGPAVAPAANAPGAFAAVPKAVAQPLTETRFKGALAALDEVLAGPATGFRELRRALPAALEPLLVGPDPVPPR